MPAESVVGWNPKEGKLCPPPPPPDVAENMNELLGGAACAAAAGVIVEGCMLGDPPKPPKLPKPKEGGCELAAVKPPPYIGMSENKWREREGGIGRQADRQEVEGIPADLQLVRRRRGMRQHCLH